MLSLSFTAELIYWAGPSPFYFLDIPLKTSKQIAQIAPIVTYGWGVVPAYVTVEDHEFYTALFPKDGKYLLPIKKKVREKSLLN